MKNFNFFLLITFISIAYTHAQINSIASGNWENSTTWDCACIPSITDDVIIRHSITMDASAGNVSVKSIRVSNETSPSPFNDAELTIRGGITLAVLEFIQVVSFNNSGGGDDVRFTIRDDDTVVTCSSFLWQRNDSADDTELLFRMYNNSQLIVLNDFVLENIDDTSSENSADFKMGDDTSAPVDEAPMITVGGNFIARVDKINTVSNLAILLREHSTINVTNNMTLSMVRAPENSDIYLYLTDLPSRSTPGSDNLTYTYSSLNIGGTLTLEIQNISSVDHPDIRCDIRGNANVTVGNLVLRYLNGDAIASGNGLQDIDFILYDNTTLTITSNLTFESELNTETINNLLYLRDNAICLLQGDIIMRADADDLENKILVDNTAVLELKGNANRHDGTSGSNYTTEGMIEFLNSSVFKLSGTVQQTLPWAQNGHYRNLIIENTSGQFIALEGDVRINGLLTMNAGILQSNFSPNSSNDDNLYVIDFLTTASADLGNTNSFITGRVRVTDRNAVGNSLNLPLGFASGGTRKWGPVTVNAFDVAINSSFYIQYLYSPPPLSSSFALPLTQISTYEYWEIGRNSGGNWATGEVFSTSTFTIYWDNACLYSITDASTLYGAWLDNNNTIGNETDDIWRAGNTITTLGEVCDTADSDAEAGGLQFNFSNSGSNRTRGITLATSNFVDNPLPVTLSEFKAELLEVDNVKLSWKTSNELNSAYFVVMRSFSGHNFIPIDTLAAAGTSSHLNNYSSIDRTPIKGTNYYYLLQVDLDNTTTYSKIISVNLTEIRNANIFQVYPNPAKNTQASITALIREDLDSKSAQFKIYSITGVDVTHLCNVQQTTPQELVITISELNSGAYILEYRNESFYKREKIIIH
jgi:hypothetical protein